MEARSGGAWLNLVLTGGTGALARCGLRAGLHYRLRPKTRGAAHSLSVSYAPPIRGQKHDLLGRRLSPVVRHDAVEISARSILPLPIALLTQRVHQPIDFDWHP